jgi:hypothetical protein
MFQITRNVWQGRFASRKLIGPLQRAGITHIINVGEAPSLLAPQDGPFRAVASLPIEDLTIIPTPVAIRCADALHQAICDGDSNVYIHCVAGWHRNRAVALPGGMRDRPQRGKMLDRRCVARRGSRAPRTGRRTAHRRDL